MIVASIKLFGSNCCVLSLEQLIDIRARQNTNLCSGKDIHLFFGTVLVESSRAKAQRDDLLQSDHFLNYSSEKHACTPNPLSRQTSSASIIISQKSLQSDENVSVQRFLILNTNSGFFRLFPSTNCVQNVVRFVPILPCIFQNFFDHAVLPYCTCTQSIYPYAYFSTNICLFKSWQNNAFFDRGIFSNRRRCMDDVSNRHLIIKLAPGQASTGTPPPQKNRFGSLNSVFLLVCVRKNSLSILWFLVMATVMQFNNFKPQLHLSIHICFPPPCHSLLSNEWFLLSHGLWLPVCTFSTSYTCCSSLLIGQYSNSRSTMTFDFVDIFTTSRNNWILFLSFIAWECHGLKVMNFKK